MMSGVASSARAMRRLRESFSRAYRAGRKSETAAAMMLAAMTPAFAALGALILLFRDRRRWYLAGGALLFCATAMGNRGPVT